MNTNNNTISISQLRQDATRLIDLAVSRQNPLTIMQRSKPRAILVDYFYYHALEEAVLDLTDAAEAEKAKTETASSFTDYFKKRFAE